MFLKVTSIHKNKNAFLYKKNGAQLKVSYNQLFNDVLLLSNYFEQSGIKQGDKVMFVADNRYEWILSDLALLSLGAISVPRGNDTPTHELEYISSHSDCSYLIIENIDILSKHSDMTKKLKYSKIFIMDEYETVLDDKSIITQDKINHFVNLHHKYKVDDIFSIIYTSGTTGKPKGVMLNHTNMIYNLETVPTLLSLTKDDLWLSILPPWHVFERGVEYVSLASGCTIAYSSPKTFTQDLEYYQPTLVATVPRVWESIYSKVNTTLNKEPNKAYIFNLLVSISKTFRYNKRVLEDKLPKFKHENILLSFSKKSLSLIKLILLYPLFFIAKSRLSAVHKKFGGRLRYAISGGGSLPLYVDEWIDALDIKIVNSYGMTECSPSIAGRAAECDVFGTVGAPLPRTDLRIVNDRMQSVAPGVIGDIQIKGPQVMNGYYNEDVQNIKTFTADGYLKTGDLGMLTLTGELILTGRSKEIIVLSNGENIDPTRIEAAISILPFINDSMLVGQDKKGLGLLIVADLDILKEYAQKNLNTMIESLEHLKSDKSTLNKLKAELNQVLHTNQGFKPFEKLQNIHFLENSFVEGEELTNTLKKRRHIIENKYKEIINNTLK